LAQARVRLFGYVKPILWVGLADPYPVRAMGRLQLGVEGGAGGGISYYGAFDMEVDDSFLFQWDDPAGRGGAAFFPVELYARYALGPFDFKLGKQFIFWGQTDWINPTDVLCAWDYLNISSEIEDYRIAAWALRTQAFAGPVTFDFVWIPLGLPHRFGSLSPAASMANAISKSSQGIEVKVEEFKPKGTIEDSELALRVGANLGGFDFHLMGYWGRDKNPTIRVKPQIDPQSKRPTALLIQPSYERIIVTGFDLSRPLGSLMIKLEGAYTHTQDFEGKDTNVSNPHVEGVFNLTYTFSTDFKISLQYAMTYRLHYDYALEEEARQKSQNPQHTPQTYTHSVTLNLRWKIISILGVQLTSVFQIDDPSAFVLGFFDLELVDALRLYVGVVGFFGPQESFWGKMFSFSRAFLELKYSF